MRHIAWLFRLALVTGAGALLLTAVVVAVSPRLWDIANAHRELPLTLPDFEPLAQRTYVYDADGNEIAVYELENIQPITLDHVPPHVIAAFLAVEDTEFYAHRGVNVRSLIRAALSNFASDAPQQGASTITMQVVKNELMAGIERDGRYKVLQMHYAAMLEKEMTKNEILQRYLNTVFFGNNAYGLQAGAETYFAKDVSELSFIEAAFLAGLVRSPSGFDPINKPERSRARFLQVLDRLVDDGLITEFERDYHEVNFAIPERVKSIPTRAATKRTYFTEALRDYLLNRSTLLGDTYQDRYNRLFRGGLRIHTTLVPALQQRAEEARNILPNTPQGFDASIVSLDSATGAIRAMVGGRGFVPNENEVNMALSPRQTGSAIKLFILSAAVQAGAQPGDLIDGTKPCTLPNPGNPDEPFQITDGVGKGPSTLAEMTSASINCAFARLSQIVGLYRVVDTVYRMSESPYLFRDQPREDRRPVEPFASFATGANELSPLDMAAGGQTLANEGLHHAPYYVEYIDGADGARLYTHDDPGVQALDRDAALTTIDILKGVLRTGTGRRYPMEGWSAAGKTGTQEDNTNAWFVGFTKHLTTAVWVGDPDAYTPMRNIPEFEGLNRESVQGGRYPTQIWKAFMDPVHVGVPVVDWEPPPPPVRQNARLYLPDNECLYRVVGYEVPTTTTEPGAEPPAPTTTAASQPPTGTAPTTTPAPTTTLAPVPIIVKVDGGTTIPPDVLDPRAPLPTTATNITVRRCA